MPKPAANLAIFAAGTHVATDGTEHTFSEADVRDLVESYDPDLHEAPLVVGHPKTDAPAYGWARSLTVGDNGHVVAEPHQVEAQFAELVNSGRFKRISSSIYLPTSPGNPKPGHFYLKHIGFLGAAAPAVKGLRAATFAEDDGAIEFAAPITGLGYALTDILQRLRDWFVERDGVEAADKLIPNWQIRSIGEITHERHRDPIGAAAYADPTQHLEIDMSQQNTPAQFAEREQQLATRETQINTRDTELTERERALAEREAKALRDDAAAFAEGLVEAGKLLPRQKAPVVELLLALPVGTAIEFAEGDQQVKKPAGDALRGLLSELPKQVDFSEKSRAEGEPAAASFAAPAGMQVSASRAELYDRAKAYQAQHPDTSWAAAVAAVGG